MFDQILKLVKEHFSQHPEVADSIPPDQEDDVHREVATHITNTHLQERSGSAGGLGGIVTNALGGGLVGSLASKFGLSPAITGAIAASLPAILQKFLNHHNEQDPASNTIYDQASSKPM